MEGSFVSFYSRTTSKIQNEFIGASFSLELNFEYYKLILVSNYRKKVQFRCCITNGGKILEMYALVRYAKLSICICALRSIMAM